MKIFKMIYKPEGELFDKEITGLFIETPLGFVRVKIMEGEFTEIKKENIIAKIPVTLTINGKIKFSDK